MMPKCESCGRPFKIVSASDYTTRGLIMLIWSLRRTNCRTCLDAMQIEWDEAKWAASIGVPTKRES